MVEALGNISKTRVRIQDEILAGCWEALATGRADLLICPRIEALPQDVKAETIGTMKMIWVAAPTHYVHRRSGSLMKRPEKSIVLLPLPIRLVNSQQ